MYVCFVFLSFFNFSPPGCVLWKTDNQSCKKKRYVFFLVSNLFLGCSIVTSFNVLALWPKGPNVRQLYEKLKSIQRLTVRALRLTNQRFSRWGEGMSNLGKVWWDETNRSTWWSDTSWEVLFNSQQYFWTGWWKTSISRQVSNMKILHKNVVYCIFLYIPCNFQRNLIYFSDSRFWPEIFTMFFLPCHCIIESSWQLFAKQLSLPQAVRE